MHEKVIQEREAIAISITERGLLSSTMLSSIDVPSMQSWTNDVNVVCGRLLPYYPQNTGLTKAYITDGLYGGYESVLPVIAERPRGSDPILFPDPNVTWSSVKSLDADKIQTIERRIQACIVIVCDEAVSDIPDMMAASRVNPYDITEFLIPALIWEQYEDSGIDKKLSSLANVHVIDELVTKLINFDIKIPLSVYNFEKVLLQLIEEKRKGLWIHGVRFPIDDDYEMSSLG